MQRGFQPGAAWNGNSNGAPTKKNTIIAVLRDNPGISTRRLARLAGVTEKTAAKWRAAMQTQSDDDTTPLLDYIRSLEQGSRGETPAPSK